jgi:hypothetical protein
LTALKWLFCLQIAAHSSRQTLLPSANIVAARFFSRFHLSQQLKISFHCFRHRF